jgi:hypothetical protein
MFLLERFSDHQPHNEHEAMFYLKQSIREARDIKADFIALDALVWVAGIHARRGELERAIALFSLIRHHPKTDPETIQSMENLMPEIIESISPNVIQRAEEQGKSLDLESVLDEVIL